MKIDRFYIPKRDGSMRMISSPKEGYRIYSHMFLLIINVWIESQNKFPANMFGSIENRGAKDAWNRIIKETINAPYIYEFDLAKCFDSLRHDYIDLALLRQNLPFKMRRWIMDVLRSYKNNFELESIIEEEEKVLNEYNLYSSYLIQQFDKPEWAQDFLKRDVSRQMKVVKEWDAWVQCRRAHVQTHPHPRFDALAGLKLSQPNKPRAKVPGTVGMNIRHRPFSLIGNFTGNVERPTYSKPFHMGVPQGWALSPLLANLVIKEIAKPFEKNSLYYMDDGLWWAEDMDKMREILLKCMDWSYETGQLIATKKSGWVKYEGRWQKPLIFLGLKIDESRLTAKDNTPIPLAKDKAKQTDYQSRWFKHVLKHGITSYGIFYAHNKGIVKSAKNEKLADKSKLFKV